MAEIANRPHQTPIPGEATRMQSVPLSQNPVLRQLGVMVGIAASVALGVAVVLWSQTPNYSILSANLGEKDAQEVLDVLQQSQIPYKLDNTTGAVMVPSGDLQNARMKLAGQGLPRSHGMGFELLQQENGFGTSRLVEAARYQKAMEGELARTISSLSSVQSARVHLATPKPSVFVQERKVASASVVVKLYSGRVLDKGQVDAILHLVASSVPELEPTNVTVVDHKGNMLSGRQDGRELTMSTRQFDYTRKLEDHYKGRIEDLLAPMLGVGKVRAEVTADVDFTATEQTEERFNPDAQAVRSEQLTEDTSNSAGAQGVPGALTNQPPAAGTAPEQAAGGAAGSASGGAGSSSKRSVRNYEVDKTISHTKLASGKVRRLSVAVVVDDRLMPGAAGGEVTRVERTPEELERITDLVREAVGFNAQRGDSVRVINSAFLAAPEPEALPALQIWEQPWFWDVAKQVGGVLLVLLLIFGVLKPTISKLTATPSYQTAEGGAGQHGAFAEGGHAGQAGQLGHAGGQGQGMLESEKGEPLQLTGKESYEETLDAARQLVQNDPKRVSQMIKQWVAEG